MIKIRVPATSANLGTGFDTLGIALTLYNDFYFEPAKEWEYVGFLDQYSETNRNIIAQTILQVYRLLGYSIIPLKIIYEGKIPNKKGLGSSASCIVAGVMAANYFTGNKLTKDEIFSIASDIEGHPDNVASTVYGGFTCAISGKTVKVINYEVNQSLLFIVAVPKTTLSTQTSRRVLPRVQDYAKITHNVSRAINIPYALKKGDLELLKLLFDDMLHEPYRLPLIKNALEIKEIVNNNNLPLCLSGSGSSLLIISKDKDILRKLDFLDWEFMVLKIDNRGARYE